MRDVLALILAGGTGDRLSLLSEERAKPAVPFAGRYRVIDFTLSNCVNSGIYNVAVLTQYNPRSLAQHLGIGKPWDLDRADGGLVLLQPYLGKGKGEWYQGTADAIYQNISFIEEQPVETALVLAGDHIYTMRYDRMIAFHRQRGAEATVGVVEVSEKEARRMGNVMVDLWDRIMGFEEKPIMSRSNLASMGIYVFNKEFLVRFLEEGVGKKGMADFGRDVLPAMVKEHLVLAYPFRGYWRDVGTVEAYWKANMDLIVDLPPFNLYDPQSPIRAAVRDLPPVKTGPQASISRSLISHGCIINGGVRNSILSPGVYVERGAWVVDSVIFDNTRIEIDSLVDHCIIDKEAWIGRGAQVGWGDDYAPNQEEPDYLNCGITLVGKGAKIPPGTTIGHNCKVGCWVEMEDFPSQFIASGASVVRQAPRQFRR